MYFIQSQSTNRHKVLEQSAINLPTCAKEDKTHGEHLLRYKTQQQVLSPKRNCANPNNCDYPVISQRDIYPDLGVSEVREMLSNTSNVARCPAINIPDMW